MIDLEDVELGALPIQRVKPVSAYRQGKKSWIELPTKGGRMMRVSHEFLDGDLGELGVIPLIAYGGAAAASALTAWAMSSSDEWEDVDVFNARMADMHASMRDMNRFADSQCPNWKPSNPKYAEWKRLINGFGGFYGKVGGVSLNVTAGEAKQAKDYARALAAFAAYFTKSCGIKGGYKAPPTPPKPAGGFDLGTFISGLGTGGMVAAGVLAYLLLKDR